MGVDGHHASSLTLLIVEGARLSPRTEMVVVGHDAPHGRCARVPWRHAAAHELDCLVGGQEAHRDVAVARCGSAVIRIKNLNGMEETRPCQCEFSPLAYQPASLSA